MMTAIGYKAYAMRGAEVELINAGKSVRCQSLPAKRTIRGARRELSCDVPMPTTEIKIKTHLGH